MENLTTIDFDLPSTEGDSISAEVHQIFEGAAGAVSSGALTVDQIRQVLVDSIDYQLKDIFTTPQAKPTVQVKLTWVNKRPVFNICASVYGREFKATVS